MMKKMLCSIILFSVVLFKAQVGVNTNTPKADMHIVGDLQVTKDIKPGGSDVLPGNPGISGEMLVSQGVGVAPVWKNIDALNVPIESTLRNSTISSSSTAGNSLKVIYDTQLRDNTAYVNYIGSGNFTVLKGGFYDVTAYLRYFFPSSTLAGTAVTSIKKNGIDIVASTTAHVIGTSNIHHNVTKISLFAAGDVIAIDGVYSRAFTLTNSSISFMYLGN